MPTRERGRPSRTLARHSPAMAVHAGRVAACRQRRADAPRPPARNKVAGGTPAFPGGASPFYHSPLEGESQRLLRWGVRTRRANGEILCAVAGAHQPTYSRRLLRWGMDAWAPSREFLPTSRLTYMPRPSTPTYFLTPSISASNSAGSSDCGPSEKASSGLG